MKHTGQNQFHGSTGNQKVKKGGAQAVIARHVIGAFECWCQGELCWVDLKSGLQTWIGKEQGKPHPSQAVMERLQEMVHMQDTLERKEVKTYPKRVQDTLLTLVNECHVKCRIVSGTELLLYPPDGKSRPFKVLSRRGEKQAMGFLEKQFIAAYDIHMPTKKEPDVGEPTQTFTAPAPPKKAVKAVPAPGFTAKKAAPVSPKPAAPVRSVTEPDTTTVWTRHLDADGKPLENWETDGKVIRCIPCRKEGKEWTTESRNAVGGHTRAAHGDGGMWTPEARAKSTEVRRTNRMKEQVAEAIDLLNKAIGTDAATAAEMEDLRVQVRELDEALDQMRQDRDNQKQRADDAEARLALAREAMSV